MTDQSMSETPCFENTCPLCAYTGSDHTVFEEIMGYVADNAHRVHLNKLVKHLRAALRDRLQISLSHTQVRTHLLAHQLSTPSSATSSTPRATASTAHLRQRRRRVKHGPKEHRRSYRLCQAAREHLQAARRRRAREDIGLGLYFLCLFFS